MDNCSKSACGEIVNLSYKEIEDLAKYISANPSRPSKIGRKKNGEPRSHNESGLLGAFQAGGYGKWKSRIRIGKKVIYLKNSEGKTYFHSAEEAHRAYISAAKELGISTSQK